MCNIKSTNVLLPLRHCIYCVLFATVYSIYSTICIYCIVGRGPCKAIWFLSAAVSVLYLMEDPENAARFSYFVSIFYTCTLSAVSIKGHSQLDPKFIFALVSKISSTGTVWEARKYRDRWKTETALRTEKCRILRNCRSRATVKTEAVPRLRRSVAGLSPQLPGFDPMKVGVGFVVGKVTLRQISSIIPPIVHIHAFIIDVL